MNVSKIRKDFPIVNDWIYLDNACTGLKPRQVTDAVSEYYEKYSVCSGRSTHSLSTELQRRIEAGRDSLRELLNAESADEIIYTKNCTEGINLVSRGLGFKKEDVVLTTDKEHNSNLVPWIKLHETTGTIYRQVPTDKGDFDIEAFKENMSPKVKLVSMVHTSNLDGSTIPAREIAEVVHDHGGLFMLDAAQSVPHRPVDVKKIDVDLMAFSVHKMIGPTGVGVLYGKKDLLEDMEPLLYGGGGVKNTTSRGVVLQDRPQKFESGQQNYASLFAVKTAVDYLTDIGTENIQNHETELNEYVTKELMGYVKIIGPEEASERSGIFNFYIDELGPHEVALLLEEQGILTRGGMQCVHSWYNENRIQGGTRASFYLYNTLNEAKKFLEVVKEYIG